VAGKLQVSFTCIALSFHLFRFERIFDDRHLLYLVVFSSNLYQCPQSGEGHLIDRGSGLNVGAAPFFPVGAVTQHDASPTQHNASPTQHDASPTQDTQDRQPPNVELSATANLSAILIRYFRRQSGETLKRQWTAETKLYMLKAKRSARHNTSNWKKRQRQRKSRQNHPQPPEQPSPSLSQHPSPTQQDQSEESQQTGETRKRHRRNERRKRAAKAGGGTVPIRRSASGI